MQVPLSDFDEGQIWLETFAGAFLQKQSSCGKLSWVPASSDSRTNKQTLTWCQGLDQGWQLATGN